MLGRACEVRAASRPELTLGLTFSCEIAPGFLGLVGGACGLEGFIGEQRVSGDCVSLRKKDGIGILGWEVCPRLRGDAWGLCCLFAKAKVKSQKAKVGMDVRDVQVWNGVVGGSGGSCWCFSFYRGGGFPGPVALANSWRCFAAWVREVQNFSGWWRGFSGSLRFVSWRFWGK
jgi:hypothetical protein